MSVPLGASLIALLAASLFSLLELVTSEYPRTYGFLLRASIKPYAYASIYGAIAFVVAASLGYLVQQRAVTVAGLGLSNAWIRALVVGLTIKAFMHVRLFTVGVRGSGQFPVGIETIVQLFEPWLLRGIQIDHFNAVRRYIAPRAAKYANLTDAKDIIRNNLPASFSEVELSAFRADIDKAPSVQEAMTLYLDFLGAGSFDRVFPA